MPIAPSVSQRSLDLQSTVVNEAIHGYPMQRTSCDCGPRPAQPMYTALAKAQGTLQKGGDGGGGQEICLTVCSLLSPQGSSK